MQKLIGILFAIAALAAASTPFMSRAEEPAVIIEVFNLARIVYCATEKDADTIAETFLEKGEDAAAALFLDGSSALGGACFVRFIPFRIVKLVSSRHNRTAVMNVYEINDLDGETFYFVRGAYVAAPEGHRS